MVAMVFQAPQASATNATVVADGNMALASRGATVAATSETVGYEASKAIDGSPSTSWASASTTPGLTVTFAGKYYVLEVHVHMATISGTDPVVAVAQPDLDFYADAEGNGAWTLVKSVRGNANLDLVVSLGATTAAKLLKVQFLTPVTHTHEKTVTRCVEWAYDDYTGKRLGCVSYQSTTQTYTDSHPPRVNELEAWGNLYDWDGDGLSNGYEESVIYRQDAMIAGLPQAIPNNGQDVLVFPVGRPLWSGVGTRAFLDLEVDHASPGDLVVSVGSWDGAAWQDRLVWVPGTYSYGSIWDTVAIPYSYTAPGCERHWDPVNGVFYCVTVMVKYTGTNYYPSRAVTAGTGERLVLTSDTVSSTYVASMSSMPWRARIDLTDPTLEPAETNAGFRAPALNAPELQSRGSWRILVRDWNPDAGAGSLRSASIRTEEKSDPRSSDTDRDGVLSDGDELNPGLRTFPVALDTDFDGLTDVFEKDPQYLSWTIDGVARYEPKKTSPTLADSDGDGLSDSEERALGLDGVVTDPTNPDSDSDGLWDGLDVGTQPGEKSHYADPTRSDTDGDTIPDGTEVRPRSLPLTINGVAVTRSVSTLPYSTDSDSDGLTDNEEWYGTSVYGVVTDPSDADTDDDGLADGSEQWTVYLIGGLQQLETVITKIEGRASLAGVVTTYLTRSSPVSSDSDGDGVSDLAEFTRRSDPWSTDTDGDRLSDAVDDDPTVTELGKPLIAVTNIVEQLFVDWNLKRYVVTYTVMDTAGVVTVSVYKDGNYASPVANHNSANLPQSVTYTDNFDVSLLDAFDGAKWEIWASDFNGNVDFISLKQPTVLDAVGNFITSATVNGLGPQSGGELSGAWYAFRDTVVDLATLFLSPQSILDGGKAVADAFTKSGVEALFDLGKSLYEFIDGTQETANPYTDGTYDHLTFRIHWYAGYIAATIGLMLVGSAAAKEIVQGIKAANVFQRISGALSDLSSVAKVTEWVNRLRGIGLVNSRVLIAGVFTAAFATAAYLWPEIFGEWFGNYLGGAFVLMSVYNLAPLGLADDVVRKAGRVITRGGISDVEGFIKRFYGKFGKDATDRLIRDLEGLADFQVPGYRWLLHNIDVTDNLGFAHEARVAARHGAENIEWLDRQVSTSAGSTDLDILLRNGDIIEARSSDLSLAAIGSTAYQNFIDDMAKKQSRFSAWRLAEGRVGNNMVSFAYTPHADILKWLADHGFGYEVVT